MLRAAMLAVLIAIFIGFIYQALQVMPRRQAIPYILAALLVPALATILLRSR